VLVYVLHVQIRCLKEVAEKLVWTFDQTLACGDPIGSDGTYMIDGQEVWTGNGEEVAW